MHLCSFFFGYGNCLTSISSCNNFGPCYIVAHVQYSVFITLCSILWMRPLLDCLICLSIHFFWHFCFCRFLFVKLLLNLCILSIMKTVCFSEAVLSSTLLCHTDRHLFRFYVLQSSFVSFVVLVLWCISDWFLASLF